VIPQVFNQPRVKLPNKSEKHRFPAFKDAVDRQVKAEGMHLSPVIDDTSFLHRYKALSKILVPCAEETFGWNSQYKKGHAVDRVCPKTCMKTPVFISF
jgi:hypothetical protein